MTPSIRAAIALVGVAGMGGAVHAHALQERYDLPLPLPWVIAGGCAAVALTFALAALFATAPAHCDRVREQYTLHVPPPIALALRSLGLLLFLLTIATALWGTRDPLMNLAPTLVWIVAWLGLSFVCALAVDIWPLLDPWRTLHDILRAATRWSPRPRAWPAAIGVWPAALLLLAWNWLEVVFPIATSPTRLGSLLVAWTFINVAGMLTFGRATWQARADVFAVTFATYGHMAPARLANETGDVQPVHGLSAFVMAMLATVIFDGLHGHAAWNTFADAVHRGAPAMHDVNGYRTGTAGLVTVWLAFVAAYGIASRPALQVAAAIDRPVLAARLAITLVPIAVAYQVAHNFSTLVLQGQRVFALFSDPFGRGWDLFGTAAFYPDIALLDARATWFIATFAIVAGHALSIVWSHHVVLAAGVPPRRTTLALVPLSLLMVVLTALSLFLLASADEPM